MIQLKHSFIPTIRDTDWRAGDGNIVFSAVVPNASWTPFFHFLERQKFSYDSDGCEVFSTQEIIDAEIDQLIQSGKVGQDVVSHLTALGFMDSNSDDGKHVHRCCGGCKRRIKWHNADDGFGRWHIERIADNAGV